MSTLTSRPVTRLGSTSPSLAFYTNSKADYDYAIGGIPFLSSASPTDRSTLRGVRAAYSRVTADYRKDQIDQSTSPGEQSLVYWWLRSQLSFHVGAGITFEEPESDQPTLQYRFDYSDGLDLFTTKGQASFLPQSTMVQNYFLERDSGIEKSIMGATDGNGADCFFEAGSQVDGSGNPVIIRYAATTPDTGGGTAVEWGPTGTGSGKEIVLSICQDGTNYYVANNIGIYTGTLVGGAGSLLWNLSASHVTIRWVKERLVAGIGQKLYELTGLTPPTLPADGTVGHLYTHPNANWQWTAITDVPSAIIAAGFAGSNSAIYKMTLTAGDGTVPALSTPTIIAKLPAGETVHALANVLDTFVAIGTSKGVRIATIDADGNLQYGPLNVDTNGFEVDGFAIRDRFVYFTWTNGLSNGNDCLGVIDLGQPTDEFGRYAYSTHLKVDASQASDPTAGMDDVCVVGGTGRLAYVQHNGNVWYESNKYVVDTATLQTGKIRFHTIEPKLFKFLKARSLALAGSISAEVTAANGVSQTVNTWSTAGDTDLAEVPFPSSVGPCEWAYVTFTFNATSDLTQGPTFLGYQIKALPAQKNQRNIQIPVAIFDFEADRNETKVGYEGYAWDRLNSLEQMEEARDVVLFQDLTDWGTESRQVVIDQIDFEMTEPPTGFSGFGGVALITLRTVT